jgi:hypothetical protein
MKTLAILALTMVAALATPALAGPDLPGPNGPTVIAADPVIAAAEAKRLTGPPIGAEALSDHTGLNGGPRWHADQDLSYGRSCGFVHHRFFDENGNWIVRPVRVCN